MAAGNLTVRPGVSYGILVVSRIMSSCTGSVRPYGVVNRILFIQAGLAYYTNKVEVLFSAYFPHFIPAQR